MKTTYIDVDKKWGVIICHDFDILDWDDMRAIMRTFGMSEDSVRKALKVLSNYDTGLCVSRYDIRMSCIFISKSTSEEQWWDTLAHELLDHCQRSIVDYYGVEYVGEDSAWLTGYLMRKAVKQLGEPCR